MSLIKLAKRIRIEQGGPEAYAMGGYYTMPGHDSSHYTIGHINPNSKISRFLTPLHSIFDNAQTTKEVHDLGISHELSEAKFGRANAIGGKKMVQINQGLFNMPTGRHFSLGVLGEEANDVLKVSKKVQDRHTKLRYMTGESDLLKQVTGKRYGVDKFDKQDIKKLFHHNSLGGRMDVHAIHVPSKTLIGKVTGTAIGALAGSRFNKKDKYNESHETRNSVLGGIAGNVLGSQAEKFVRLNILKLHKR